MSFDSLDFSGFKEKGRYSRAVAVLEKYQRSFASLCFLYDYDEVECLWFSSLVVAT